MSRRDKILKYTGLIGILLGFPLAFVLIFSNMDHNFDSLPYFGDQTVVQQSNGTADTLRYKVPPYSFINQDGSVLKSEDLSGKVYLATFFSTNSPFLPKISKRLLNVNFRYRDEPDIALVCFSLDPEHDTPEVLAKYTKDLRVDQSKFYFFTSDSIDMIGFAREAFLIDDPLNSSVFWLVDTRNQLRGKYDGNKEEEMQRAIEDIALLKKELDLERVANKE